MFHWPLSTSCVTASNFLFTCSAPQASSSGQQSSFGPAFRPVLSSTPQNEGRLSCLLTWCLGTVCGQAAGELCYCRWDVIIADEPERCFSDQHPEKTEINMPMVSIPLCFSCLAPCWPALVASEPQFFPFSQRSSICFLILSQRLTSLPFEQLAGATIPALAVILCLVCAYKRANPTREPSLYVFRSHFLTPVHPYE